MQEQNNGTGVGDFNPENYQDGFTIQRAESMVKEFLNPGEDFEDALLRSSMTYADAMDHATMYRKGIAYRREELVLHALHGLMASAAADGGARDEGLQAAIGTRFRMLQKQPRQGWLNKLFQRGASSNSPPPMQ